ncbi:alcohol dehydrogenase catalytic domain-containing protein [Actinoplanes sp. CA-131856]
MTRAVVMDDYGPPDVLRLAGTDVPAPGDEQIRVTVRYAAVGPTDLAIRAGHLKGVFPGGPGTVLGFEAAGVVESVATAFRTSRWVTRSRFSCRVSAATPPLPSPTSGCPSRPR